MSFTFRRFVLSLRNQSNEDWLTLLKQFSKNHANDTDFSSFGEGKEEFMSELVLKIAELKQSVSDNSTIQFAENDLLFALESISVVCDSLRVCARETDGLKQTFGSDHSAIPLFTVFDVCIWMVPITLARDGRSIEATTTNIIAFRCLINILFNCHEAFQLFCGKESHILRLVRFLSLDGQVMLPVNVMLQSIKLLYLISAQNLSCLSASIRNQIYDQVVSNMTCLLHSTTTSIADSSSRTLIKDMCKLLNALKVEELPSQIIEVSEVELLDRSDKAFRSIVNEIVSIQVHDDQVFSYQEYWKSFDKTMVDVSASSMATAVAGIEQDLLEVKRSVLQVAMNYPSPIIYAESNTKEVIIEMCYLLGYQFIIIERNKDRMKEDDRTALVTPTLVTLTNIITDNEDMKRVVKSIIFPNAPPSAPSTSQLTREESEEMMHARDAPKGTLRELLIRQMTSLAHLLKRCSSELLYLLCNEDKEEFILRTGYGNAVAQLQLKGQLLGSTVELP